MKKILALGVAVAMMSTTAFAGQTNTYRRTVGDAVYLGAVALQMRGFVDEIDALQNIAASQFTDENFQLTITNAGKVFIEDAGFDEKGNVIVMFKPTVTPDSNLVGAITVTSRHNIANANNLNGVAIDAGRTFVYNP